jgi:hypothetical protein
MYGLGKLSINNPGNLEKTKSGTPWQGEYTCNDPRFACFTDIAHGYRAMFILLRNYIVGGSKTISEMISKWAPPSENDTAAYIKYVSANTGINPQITINANDIDSLTKIVAAMSKIENGVAAKLTEVAAGRELARSRFGEYAKPVGIGLGVIITAGVIWYIAKKKKAS